MAEPTLVLGPLLRHVGETTASIWVETDTPCRVQVGDAAAETFTVHGHHYALVDLEGLDPGSETTYSVRLDDRLVWPEPGSGFPPSRIRTHRRGKPLRLVFGSCRTAVPQDEAHDRSHGVDVLRALAAELATGLGGRPAEGDAAEGDAGEGGAGEGGGARPEDWSPLPDLLLLLGDQVYADEPSEQVRTFIRSRRDVSQPPGEEVVDFTEYAHLYRLAWSEPAVRWLLSTVSSAMIFDDHDVRDDWNTSAAWRDRMREQPWWHRRIVSALGSYWIYQHLGNLSAEERRRDPILAALNDSPADAGATLDELAARADERPESYRWSYSRDLDSNRLIVLDSRAGRVLEPGRRSMLPPEDWDWLGGLLTTDVDHLLIGTSLPFLLPTGLHHLEGWNEAVCDGAWGRRAAGAAERLRQGLDVEHWAAFQRSFVAVAELAIRVATGGSGRPPASIVFLSGDVHYSYLAEARPAARASAPVSPIYQAVCSPIRNPMSRFLRWCSIAASFGVAGLLGRMLSATTRLPASPLEWRVRYRPRFENAVAVLDLDGRRGTLRWLAADQNDPRAALRELDEIRLA